MKKKPSPPLPPHRRALEAHTGEFAMKLLRLHPSPRAPVQTSRRRRIGSTVENVDLLRASLRAEADASCAGPGKSRSGEQFPRYEIWVVSPFFQERTLPETALG